MRVWLAGFVILFVGAELFEWFAQLESVQASGYVVMGMGLAVASNWKKNERSKDERETMTDELILAQEKPRPAGKDGPGKDGPGKDGSEAGRIRSFRGFYFV
ncbi:MAG: hypothetical protein HC800_18395 [Phormidesmis sp. RL_2_1]|nr:hypothetical protein [Phormidesmis sp. RL_2_1]